MVLMRNPKRHLLDRESIGFMTKEQGIEYWENEDFAPIVDTKRILDEAGTPIENEYRFTHRKITRAGSPSTTFKIRGPVGPLSYTHQPLAQNDTQIRIVTLLPGTGLDHLRCSMSVHNFPSDVRKYTCLSYVWGARSGTYPMYLDSGTIGITENLMAALWHIRRKRKPIRLWIDALCINQEGDEEKGHQVRMMGTIYENADRLISWLGSAQSEIAQISRDLNRLFQASLYWEKNQDTRLRLVTSLRKVNWINLRPVFDSAYWTRAWIVQEVAVREEYRALYPLLHNKLDKSQYPMARRNAQWPRIRGFIADYLLYGQCKISLWCIVVVTYAIITSEYDLDFGNICQSLSNAGEFSETLFFSGQGGFSHIIAPSSDTLISQLEQCSGKTMDFAAAYLHSCRHLRVGLKRDRLFSLAGIHKHLEIVVDYNKPDTEVVLDIAEKLVSSLKTRYTRYPLPRQNDGLRLALDRDLLAADTLVSWVPYGESIPFPPKFYSGFFVDLLNPPFEQKRTDTFENTTFIRGPGWGKLHTQCMYRVRVAKLFEKDDYTQLRKAMAACFGGNQLDDEGRDFLLQWLQYLPPFNARLLKLLEQYLDIEKYGDDDVDESLVEVVWFMHNRGHSLGILSDGNLFVGCSYCQIGDEVVSVEGIHHPFVVRNATPEGEVLFVEVAILAGIPQAKFITERRQELIIV